MTVIWKFEQTFEDKQLLSEKNKTNDCYQKSYKHLLRTELVSQLVSGSDIIIVLFVSAHLEPLCYWWNAEGKHFF